MERSPGPPHPAPLPASPERLSRSDTALLVVDVQQRLLPAISGAERIVWNCRRLLLGAELLGISVSVTEQNPEKLGPTDSRLPIGTRATRSSKMAFSAGACGEIFADWRRAGVQRVLICGIETHVCVVQTALDLVAADYMTYVAADAVGSRRLADHETALRRLDSAGAVVTTVESALFELCEQAGTPEFRSISALVKESPPAGS
ncbi:MAG TPA: isochorismatase family protein [Lacipirellulaceae bacterium]|nr:isochorismatase family protein [Lacipirellulaceae bacterium]HMP05117.1 isochorismatase family protein [Lacipirellulaceae bacterium]